MCQKELHTNREIETRGGVNGNPVPKTGETKKNVYCMKKAMTNDHPSKTGKPQTREKP